MIYIGEKEQVLSSLTLTLQANEDGIIEAKNEKEIELCKSYKLKNLKELSEKYLQVEKSKGITNKKK